MNEVYTIDAIHDGCPLVGIADYQGNPHIYERQFDDEKDDWSDRYVLKRIDADLLALAIERQTIFLEWRKAFDAGSVPGHTHPTLALDNPRYNQLVEILTNRIAKLPVTTQLIGRFDAVSLEKFTGNVLWKPC